MADRQSSVRERQKIEYAEPPKYNVLIYNDDFTTMDFVVELLLSVFHMNMESAVQLMLNVHSGKYAVAGVYSYDVALSKKRRGEAMAREAGFPLRLECVPADE